jgi:DNA-binding PadR family transcriptional regulator
MEDLSKTSLLQLIILQSLSKEEITSEMLTRKISSDLSMFTYTASLKSKINNLLISLEMQGYTHVYFYGRAPIYSITPKGMEAIEYSVNRWKKVIETQLTCLNKMLDVCYKQEGSRESLYLSHEQYKLLTQILQSRSVLSYLSLLELDQLHNHPDPSQRAISVTQLQRVLKNRYGWTCSAPTFMNHISSLIKKGVVHIDWGIQENKNKIKMVTIKEDGKKVIQDFSSQAKHEIEEANYKFKEVKEYLDQVYNKRDSYITI